VAYALGGVEAPRWLCLPQEKDPSRIKILPSGTFGTVWYAVTPAHGLRTAFVPDVPD